MTDVLQVIKNRRSTRAFTAEQITRAELEQILEAGAWAPSGRGYQGWHFTAIHNAEKVQELAAAVRAALGLADGYRFYGAPSFIIVSYERDYEHAWLDGSAAVENMLLEAEALGLGSCWINQVRVGCDKPELRAVLTALGVPEDHMVIASIALGHIDKPTEPKPRKEGVINIVE
jgi:nitroreductase